MVSTECSSNHFAAKTFIPEYTSLSVRWTIGLVTPDKFRKLQMSTASRIIVSMCLTLGSYGQKVPLLQGAGTVSVPVLVELKSGQIAYGLSADDFSIKDNGIEQRVEIGKDAAAIPLSLVLVIQTGHGAGSQLQEFAGLDVLLENVLTGPQDQAEVITFDSRPQVLQEFTADPDEVSNSLASIAAGNSGAALLDAIHMAINSFRKAPNENRRVIVLISGEHDHGSYASDSASLIRDASTGNASVYSLSFRTGRKELVGKLRSLTPFAASANAMQRSPSEALAQLTGGEFYRFDSEKGFESRMSEIANHINNRYILTFHPNSLGPGFHSLQVDVEYSKLDILSARSGYWQRASGGAGSGGVQQ